MTLCTSFRAETPKITEDLQPPRVLPKPAQEPLPVALPHQPRAVRSERLPTERLPDLHPLSFDVVVLTRSVTPPTTAVFPYSTLWLTHSAWTFSGGMPCILASCR